MKIPKKIVKEFIAAFKAINEEKTIQETTTLIGSLEHLVKNSLAIVSGKYNPELVKKIAKHLEVEPIFLDTENFSNNYPRCERPDEITFSGKKVFIITNLQYTNIGSPLEELQLMFDACKSADEIHIILAYMCGKNDITHKPGAVPTLAWMADTISKLGAKSINWFDPHHSSHIETFHPTKRRRFYFLNTIVREFKKKGVQQIATTDFGSGKRALKIVNLTGLKTPILFTEKDHDHSVKDGTTNHHRQIGKISKDVMVIGMGDDMMLSANTMKKACYGTSQKENGDKVKIIAAAAHFDPTPDTYKNISEILNNGTLNGFITTNSNPIPQKFLDLPGFEIVDVSEVISNLVEAMDNNESTGFMFEDV